MVIPIARSAVTCSIVEILPAVTPLAGGETRLSQVAARQGAMDAPYLTWSGRSTKTIGMGDLLERYDSKLAGVLHCYDRLVLQGSLAALRYADGMSNYLRRRGIRIFDYTKFAAPLREEIRENAGGGAGDPVHPQAEGHAQGEACTHVYGWTR